MEPNESQFVSALNRIVDYGIGSILFVAPLAMAGRFAPGRLLLAILVAITACSWCLSRALSRRNDATWLWTGVEWIACCAILLVVLQLTPFSTGTLSFFSPTMPELLPLQVAESDTSLSTNEWSTVSLAPHATRGGLAMALVYTLLFFTVLQRVRRRHEVERLMKGIAFAGIAMASVGLLQYLFGNGKFLWFMEHPSRDTLVAVKGTFANENHFAHFLALALGPLLWWFVKEQSATDSEPTKKTSFGVSARTASFSRNQVLLAFGLGIVILAGLLTHSRGGLLVMFVAGSITTGLFVYQRRLGKRAILAVAVTAVIAVCAVWIHGQELLTRELSTLQTISLESLDQGESRRKIWSAVMQAAPDFAMLGSGIGSHRYVYPTYFSAASNVQYTHAESGFLHMLLEAGGPGLGLLLVGIGLSGYWILRSLLHQTDEELTFLSVPLAASWCASLLHGVFDFNWFIPANMSLTLMICALAARSWAISLIRKERIRKPVAKATWSVIASVVAVMSIFSISHYVAPARANSAWNEFVAWSLASNRFQAKSTGPGRQRNLGFVDASNPDTISTMISLLDDALDKDPSNGRAHVRMAAMCLRQFELLQSQSENAMSLAQIRDAALSSDFASHQAMSEWVNKVVQQNRVFLDRVNWHCRQAMRYTPTEGRCYMYLGEVAFLDEELTDSDFELLNQAYAVRPYDAGVQFSFGRQKLLRGDTESAMLLWKDAFGRGEKIRKRIISAIGFQAPPDEILTIFQPDVGGLKDLFDYYRRRQFEEQKAYVGQKYVAELEKQALLMTGETAGELWLDAQFVHAELGNVEAAATAATNSVMAFPAGFKNHEACALRMRDAGRFEDAIEEFEWCAARRPNEEKWTKMVAQMRKELRRSQMRSAYNVGAESIRR